MSYNGENSVDYTNSNPDYWASVNSYFESHGENDVGETGIWIPNLEKQGAESIALAASAGGVTAVGGSNYAGGSKSADTRTYADTGETESSRAEYSITRPITLASIYRGGTDYETTSASDHYGGGTSLGGMGKLPPSWQGVSISGGNVVGTPGANYSAAGGDYAGLLSAGTAVTAELLDNLLGPRDGDGLRVRGTFPTPTGSAITGAGTTVGAGTDTDLASYLNFEGHHAEYDGSQAHSIDYTNQNPAYWTNVINWHAANGTNAMGETGIWIPNFEKQGAEAIGIAAHLGGVRKVQGNNYHQAGGTELALELASIHRGGTDIDTGRGMGKLSGDKYGAKLLGGSVVGGPGTAYSAAGGDFPGLSIAGSPGSYVSTGIGTGVGAGPAKDWSAYMPSNFAQAENGGLLYQPWATNYPASGVIPGVALGTGGSAAASGTPAVTRTASGTFPAATVITPTTGATGTVSPVSEGGHDPTGGDIAHSVSTMSSMMSHGLTAPAHLGAVVGAMFSPMTSTAGTTIAPDTYSATALATALKGMEPDPAEASTSAGASSGSSSGSAGSDPESDSEHGGSG
jgi:hypothetical protein